MKRKSLSASGQKHRSLLPTPLGSRITRSQSQRSRPTSVNCEVNGALPFNLSPSAEIKQETAATASKSQAHVTLERSCSHSRFSDPFSPASQTVSVDPIENYGTGDSVVRNLIELSPMPAEVSQKLSVEIMFCIIRLIILYMLQILPASLKVSTIKGLSNVFVPVTDVVCYIIVNVHDQSKIDAT